MATNRAGGAATALDDGSLACGRCRAVLGRDAAGVHRSAAPERGTLLAEYLAVCPAAGSAHQRGAARSGPGGRSPAPGGVGSQPGPTRHGGTRRLRCPVAPQRGAVPAQDIGGTFATNTQTGAACGTRARLATDADTRQWARHVRSSSTV